MTEQEPVPVTQADMTLMYDLATNIRNNGSAFDREQLVARHRLAGIEEGKRLAAQDCPSCHGLNTSCPDGCGRDPLTGELNGTRLAAQDGEANLKAFATELLSHRGERPYRVLRGGQELWETWLPAIRAAFSVLPTPTTEATLSAADAEPITDADIKALWLKHGGTWSRPIGVHYSVEGKAFYRFARDLIATRSSASPAKLREAAQRVVASKGWMPDAPDEYVVHKHYLDELETALAQRTA